MRRAIIDQLFLGFLLLMGIVTFVATVNDETSTRNYIYDLKNIIKNSAKAMARYYESNIDMCTAQTITTNILRQQKIGLESLNDGLVSYKWSDSNSDGEPDQVTATIAQHPHDTFWYKFFDKDNFTVGPFSWTEPVNTPKNVTLTYGGEDASFTNMVGLYQLDNNNCVTNSRIILSNSDDKSRVGKLLNNGQSITSPPTHIFLISDGYNVFKNGNNARPSDGDTVTMNHCFSDVTNTTSNPTVEINGVTKNSANVYFEHNELNGDGYHHIQIIPHNVWEIYNHFVNGTGPYNGQGKKTYNDFITKCNIVNYDNNDNNNLPVTNYEEGKNDCTHDRNNQYHYAMEDLNGGGDKDFNDIFLNSTRVVIPNQLNTYTVLNDNSINLTCNGNTAPILSIQCPNTINENTSTRIPYTATDNDGNITSKIVSALNGSIVDNNNGTITYTPNNNFSGIDTLSMTIQDNEGASNTQTCTITVNEINLPPVISGNPMTSVVAGNIYSFVPIASDPDGDTLSFTISGKPSWANFSTTTGQLSGQPNNSEVGTYTNIIITVSDGVNNVSLISFNITVTENTSNNAPTCNDIPNQTVTETETLNLNLNNFCTDSDGDTLTYTVTQSNFNYRKTTNGNISLNIPDNSAMLSPVIIQVTASDGTDSVYKTFNVNIIANIECQGPFLTDFSSSSDGWTGGFRSYNYEVYYIHGQNTLASKTYNFGIGCRNKNVNISIFSANSRAFNSWEYNDKYKIYINGTIKGTYDYNNDGQKNYSATTNTNGEILIEIRNKSGRYDEKIYIDDISLSLQ